MINYHLFNLQEQGNSRTICKLMIKVKLTSINRSIELFGRDLDVGSPERVERGGRGVDDGLIHQVACGHAEPPRAADDAPHRPGPGREHPEEGERAPVVLPAIEHQVPRRKGRVYRHVSEDDDPLKSTDERGVGVGADAERIVEDDYVAEARARGIRVEIH